GRHTKTTPRSRRHRDAVVNEGMGRHQSVAGPAIVQAPTKMLALFDDSGSPPYLLDFRDQTRPDDRCPCAPPSSRSPGSPGRRSVRTLRGLAHTFLRCEICPVGSTQSDTRLAPGSCW